MVSVSMALFGDKVIVENLRDFALEVDGKSIQTDDRTTSGVGFDYRSKLSFKDMKGTMAFAVFEQLANGESIKIHVGDIIFELSKSNREALRDMLKTIESSSK